VAALPASRTQAFLDKIARVFPQFTAADNVWATSVNNLNPIVHPPMVLFNAGRIESTGGKGWNLYADGATESVARVMLAMDVERLSLVRPVSRSAIAFKDAFEALYQQYGLGKKSLSETLRQSPIHGDPSIGAPSSVDTRYITEDLPFGLAPWSSIARNWGMTTPVIDSVVHIASTMVGIDYFRQGLTVKDLGIEDMGPEDVKAFIQ
jgi:opine dehydrogenase